MKFPASPFKFTLLTAICSLFSASVHAQNVNVTFSVDMNEYNGAFSTVYLNSSLNNWCGSCQPLQDNDQDGIWETTAAVPVGSMEYKFTLDGWAVAETFTDTTLSCTKTTGQYTNRLLTVYSDQTLPTVCWEKCAACGVTGSDCSNCSDPMYFSGQSWTIKAYENSTWGPGPNYFSGRSSDVYVDNDGFLHLNIAQHNGRWYSTEVISEETMGYGVYTWVVDAQLEQMEANTVLGLFTWDNNTFQTQGNSEVDVEVARWGDINEQDILLYSVQPVWFGPYKPERTQKINTPTGSLNGVTAHRLVWTDSLITWKSWEDYADGPNEIGSWSFDLNNPPRTKDEGGQTSDPIIIPAPGATTHARMNLWLFNGAAPTNGQPYEVIIRLFSYEPY